MIPWLTLTLLTTARADEAPPAPTLEVAQWIAQGPADPDAPGQLLVIEVWATWCGPCHETFPELSRLQRDYGDKIRVVALTDDEPRVVRRTYHERAADMRFAIATTNSETVRSLMFGGFGGRGLPSVYVIDGDRVVFGGEPAALSDFLTGWFAR